jgi:hypothetical protein
MMRVLMDRQETQRPASANVQRGKHMQRKSRLVVQVIKYVGYLHKTGNHQEQECVVRTGTVVGINVIKSAQIIWKEMTMIAPVVVKKI